MDKVLESITKLITLTQENKIKWTAWSSEEEKIIKDEDSFAIGTSYRSEYKGKYLRMYQLKYKVKQPPSGYSVFSGLATIGLGDEHSKGYPYWDTSYVLEFVTSAGDSLWGFPYSDSLKDLFSSIQYQVAGVNNFLNDILND